MRGFAIAATLALVLSAAPAFAQTPPARPPAQPPAQTAPAPAPQPPAPFPAGAKIAFVDFNRIAAESAEGKSSAAKINALIQKKQVEGSDKAKKLQADQTKLQQTGSVMSDTARAQLEKDIERQQVEGQRFQQDAQAEVQELQKDLNDEFQKHLLPILQQIAQERGLQLLLSRSDAGIIWGDPGLDLSADVIKRLDAAAKPVGTPKQ
jgi:outer membrane protein